MVSCASFWVHVNLATTGVGVAGGGVWPIGVGGAVGPTTELVGNGEKDGDSDGSRMNVGEAVGAGEAVCCTNGGRVGEPDAKAMSVGSAAPGGFDR